MRTDHETLQGQVVDLARMYGWRHLHVRRSIGKGRRWVTTTNVVGWPDLLLWNGRQPWRHLAIEVKVPPDKVRPEQRAVLDDLSEAGFEVHVVTPDDLASLAAILRPLADGPRGPAGSALP